jgi:hypothetical protein
MTNTMTPETSGAAPASFASALRRAQADFLEMPGLQLTAAQGARLWCVDAALCGRVLDALVESRFLVRTRNSLFARAL